MTDIQEIPLDIAEEIKVIVEDIAEIKADEEPEPPQEAPASEAEVIKPRAKGRPKGALNKGPSKPRAKNIRIQEAPVEERVPGIRALLSKEESQTAGGSEL